MFGDNSVHNILSIVSATSAVSDYPPPLAPRRYEAKWDVGQYNYELMMTTANEVFGVICTSFWNILVVGQLDHIDDRGSHKSGDIAKKIEILEDQFGSLRTKIRLELEAKPDMTVQTLLDKLTGLPLSLRKEYESSIAKQISNMRTETQINNLFIVHLNPLTSFIDYGLIEYVIKKFGSDALKKDMRSYCSEMVVFMKETTVKQMTISGRVDDILHAKSPVELEQIFRNTLHGGEIILIEGAPGSGKSTLTVHICQRWSKGEIFQQFTIVILVQLRDPAVQRAQTIADLLPVENAEEIATELMAINGRGVLWVLDGWDELPPHLQQDSIFRKFLPPKHSKQNLAEVGKDPVSRTQFYKARLFQNQDELPPHLQQDSIFRKFLPPKHSKQNLAEVGKDPVSRTQFYKDRLLNEASIIVTSRPISSGDLHPVISSRIEVLGFTPEEQRQYFTECFKEDTKALEVLLEKIQENPVVQSICYLPLNAAFIVHTFKYRDQSLPNTEYEIYLSVVLSCIQRHYDREGRGHDLPRELASLDDLSRIEAVKKPFQCLCELAYRGVMENKVTFSSSDLPQGSNTLSLLQAIVSFLQSGKSVFYNFLHLSVQEVLSAYYIATKLSDSEQVSQFQQLFNQPRFAAVFQFYAAITKLMSPGIRQVIARIVEAKSKPLLVSLLRCLHEAQDPALCLYVAERLEYRLDLSEISLSPLDYLSISFFLSSLSGKRVSVNLRQCYISDIGTKCLTKFLDSDMHYASNVAIELFDSNLNQKDTLHTARMLYFFEHLYLSDNPIIGDTGASLISEAVRETTTLRTLILSDCGITSRGAEDLSRALAENYSLEKLDISDNNLGDEGISFVAEALKQNNQLKELWIGNSVITDKGAASLASALTVNNSLKMLHMGGAKGALTEDGLSIIAHSIANKAFFVKLAIPYGFSCIAPITGSTPADCLNREINEARKRNGLPPVQIKGEYTVCCVNVSIICSVSTCVEQWLKIMFLKMHSWYILWIFL